MNKRVAHKRMLVLILTVTMALSCVKVGGYGRYSGVANAKELATATDSGVSVEDAGEEEGEEFLYESTYSSENFDVMFKLDNVWGTGYNATVTITNTSDSVIENWCLAFPLGETISNIWNATISENHEDFYVIKNTGWNQDIPVGGSVSFGMTVYEPFTEFPEYYTIIGNQVETKREDYTIDYKITEDWGDGYKAEVTITNNKDTAIEDWRLSFEYGDNLITQIWNAVVVDNTEGKYELSCESYNQNIAPRGSVTFGFMVEPGCSGNLVENVVLREYVFNGGNQDQDEDNSEDEEDKNDEEDNVSDATAIIFGMLDEEDNKTLYLSMMASVDVERYEIYVSWDGKDYIKLGETREAEYQYIIKDDFSSSEIYAVGYDENGESVETNHIFLENTDGICAVILPDTDGDGLEDVYEIYYGSDISRTDTDEDGLGDYYEVHTSSTYPSLMDSDENGIMDGDEDYDGDGLSIIEECYYETDPLNPDTDYDNLLDGDEINVYGTNPLLADEDQDGLVDGDEIEVGTNPLNPDTDGDGVLDGDEKFIQTYTYDVENDECAVKEISITLEGTGNLQSTTTIESIMDKDVLCSGVVGLVGEPFEITCESDFDKATITFKVDKKKLDSDVVFDDLMFLWYDEENDEFVELETRTNESLGWVMVDTTHFSKYMLVNRKAWYEAWLKKLDYSMDYYGDKVNYTVLVMECSGDMNKYDPIIYTKVTNPRKIIKSCYRTRAVEKYVNNMSDSEVVAYWYFGYPNSHGHEFVVRDAQEDLLISNYPEDSNAIAYYSSALLRAYERFENVDVLETDVNKKVILTVVGNQEINLQYVEEKYIEANIVVDVVLVGNEQPTQQLIDFCNLTGGRMYRADMAEDLSKLYENLCTTNSFDKTDSDGDGLYDVIEKAGIRLTNGQIIYTDSSLPDSDYDGLLDGEEINPIPRMYYKQVEIDGVKEIRKVYEFSWNSDPNNPDTDWDGIGDNEDNCPLIRGIYSVYSDDIVIGEMAIVSSTYNSLGHSFLVYKSYIFDTLDFSDFEKGYYIDASNNSFFGTESEVYYIGINNYVTIGASGADIGEFRFTAYELFDCDTAGIFYNREFAVEINEGKDVYVNNAAYSKEVTEEQLDIILDTHREYNRYKVLSKNCAYVASKSWNRAFMSGKITVVDRPKELKKLILNMNGSYEINLRKLIGVK